MTAPGEPGRRPDPLPTSRSRPVAGLACRDHVPEQHQTKHTSRDLGPARLALYVAVAFLAGGAAQAQWRNFLDGHWLGVGTTSGFLAAWLVVLLLMYRHDRKRGRIGGER